MMVGWGGAGHGPIGVDIGNRSVRLIQFDRRGENILDVATKPFLVGSDPSSQTEGDGESRATASDATIAQAIRDCREGRNFKGKSAVLCLGAKQLHLQNFRVPQTPDDQLEQVLQQEAASRLPFPADQAEIRFLEAGTIQHGDNERREVVLLASQKQEIERLLEIADKGGLHPIGIDAQPVALMRCYGSQFRRNEDEGRCSMIAHVGTSQSMAVLFENGNPLFIKAISVSGESFDEAVAKRLDMEVKEASVLRRYNGERRSDRRDPEVAESIQTAMRPELDRLGSELAMCVRYLSVTFRGRHVEEMILTGSEANESLCTWLVSRLDLPCRLGDPLRDFEMPMPSSSSSQWDIAVGLAMKEV